MFANAADADPTVVEVRETVRTALASPPDLAVDVPELTSPSRQVATSWRGSLVFRSGPKSTVAPHETQRSARVPGR